MGCHPGGHSSTMAVLPDSLAGAPDLDLLSTGVHFLGPNQLPCQSPETWERQFPVTPDWAPFLALRPLAAGLWPSRLCPPVQWGCAHKLGAADKDDRVPSLKPVKSDGFRAFPRPKSSTHIPHTASPWGLGPASNLFTLFQQNVQVFIPGCEMKTKNSFSLGQVVFGPM